MEKLKLTVRQIVDLNNAAHQVRNWDPKVSGLGDQKRKFSYALSRCASAVKPTAEAVAAMEKPTEAYQAYDRARLKLCRQQAVRTETGEPKTVGGVFVFADPDAFEEKMEALRTEHAPALAEFEAAKKEVEDKLAETEEVELHRVEFDLVPDPIPFAILEALEPMIDHKVPPKKAE